jgi:hypothetical protein
VLVWNVIYVIANTPSILRIPRFTGYPERELVVQQELRICRRLPPFHFTLTTDGHSSVYRQPGMCKVAEVAVFALLLVASLVAAPVGGSLVAYYNFDGT